MATNKSSLQTIEQFLKQVRALVALIVIVLVFGTISLMLAEKTSITGAFVQTIDALAGSNKIPSGGIAEQLYIALKLFGAIIIWFAIWTTFGLAVEGKFGDFFKEVKTMNQIRNLHNHYIICGVGRVGKHIGERLEKAGKTVVYVEKDKDMIARLRSRNALVIDVGPIDSTVLVDAGIQSAEGIAVSLGDDGKNLLLVLEARELNPNLKIAARVNDAKLVPKFKRAGADYIILPEALGGIKLADALMGAVDTKHVFVRE
jgi:voltage-gated potassium channel